MASVLLEGEPSALAQMLAALVQANVAADPRKDRILETTRGAAELDVRDVGAVIGLKFTPGTLLVVDGPVPGADLRISADSETLVGLSAVPLRFGLPDAFTEAGRGAAVKLVTGRIKVSGLLRGPTRGLPMMRKINRLLNVA